MQGSITGSLEGRSSGQLSELLTTVIGVIIPPLEVLQGASGVIPIPFIKPLVAGVTGLLKAVHVRS